MKYCHNCGASVADGDLYCPECGERLADGDSGKASGRQSEAEGVARGYIFTNLDALGGKLGVSKAKLRDFFDRYIALREPCGVRYRLLDASNCKPRQTSKLGSLFGAAAHLKPEDGWQAHQRLLLDCYEHDTKAQRRDIDYLFIVGSDDIIPMPAVGKHSLGGFDASIRSDVPYSHLYGDDTERMIRDNTIFNHPAHLYVGRLPIAADATVDTLTTYLRNVADISANGYTPNKFYGQCDPNWKRVTATILRELHDVGWLTDYSRLPHPYAYRSMLLTPYVTDKEIDSVFNPTSPIYLFNMHGSGEPDNPNYAGCECRTDGQRPSFYSGITPKQFTEMTVANMVVAESCYGAKPNGRKLYESILLSAMNNKTVLFFGSTHVAWGEVDANTSGANAAESTPHLRCADIIARQAILSMLHGDPAGVALFRGKYANFHDLGQEPRVMDTCFEFNLFGDPSLTLYANDGKGGLSGKQKPPEGVPNAAGGDGKVISCTETDVLMQVETIYRQEQSSLLDTVRQYVDHGRQAVNDAISRHLYDFYGLSPRQLQRVEKITYGSGDGKYAYYYDKDNSYYIVTTDINHQIMSVVSSK